MASWPINLNTGNFITSSRRAAPQTIELAPDQFYRARIGGKHFGLYVDGDGRIHYFTQNSFFRELDRRYRDGVSDVDLNCDGDWSGDPFRIRHRKELFGQRFAGLACVMIGTQEFSTNGKTASALDAFGDSRLWAN
jgi:hypothetical protein